MNLCSRKVHSLYEITSLGEFEREMKRGRRRQSHNAQEQKQWFEAMRQKPRVGKVRHQTEMISVGVDTADRGSAMELGIRER